MKEIIKLNHINKVFTHGQESTTALNDINLSIYENEFISIIGKSGCGKSTLLNIIGLIEDLTSGSYSYFNQDTAILSDTKKSNLRLYEFGFIFQAFNLIPTLSVYSNIELPLLYSSAPIKKRKIRVDELLDLIELTFKSRQYPSQLSGGQKQRVAIARALVNCPKIILADEPTGALDSKNTASILNLLKKLHEQGNTIILVTHDLSVAKTANRIITLKDGKIVKDVSSK